MMNGVNNEVSQNMGATDLSAFWDELSHEIKNSLHIILGSSDLLKSGDYKEPRELVDNIHESANQLQALLNMYLSERKGVTKNFSGDLTTFEINALVENIIAQHRVMALNKDLELRLEMDSNIPLELVGASTRLVQVLNNLMGNAIHYTERGYVLISVVMVEMNGDKVKVRFSVKDSGPGISESDQKKLFNVYAQINPGHREEGRRFGLGLSICKRLLHSMNSEIVLESSLGQGSVFQFEVDFCLPENSRTKNTDSNRPRVFEGKALVVDDSPVNLVIMDKLLSKLGVECDTVTSGLEAYELIQSSSYSMLFLDINLMDISGLDLARRLKAEKIELPIVLVSADTEILKPEELVNLQIRAAISKPFNLEELKQVVFS